MRSAGCRGVRDVLQMPTREICVVCAVHRAPGLVSGRTVQVLDDSNSPGNQRDPADV